MNLSTNKKQLQTLGRRLRNPVLFLFMQQMPCYIWELLQSKMHIISLLGFPKITFTDHILSLIYVHSGMVSSLIAAPDDRFHYDSTQMMLNVYLVPKFMAVLFLCCLFAMSTLDLMTP